MLAALIGLFAKGVVTGAGSITAKTVIEKVGEKVSKYHDVRNIWKLQSGCWKRMV